MRKLRSVVPVLGTGLLVWGTPLPSHADDLNDILGYTGGKSITEDEARVIAEEHAGRSLAEAKYKERDLDATVLAVFSLPPGEDGAYLVYQVDMTRGSFSSWETRGVPLGRPSRDAQPSIARDEAVEATAAEARKHVGERADTLEWETNHWSPLSRGRVRAETEDRLLRIEATFDLTTGRMCSYWQMVLPPGPKHEPNVSSEEAVEIVRKRVSTAEVRLVHEPRLTQAPNLPFWTIVVATPDRRNTLYMVDGFTGAILVEASTPDATLSSEATASSEASAAPANEGWPAFPWLPATAGAALLLAAGVGVVLLRRRR